MQTLPPPSLGQPLRLNIGAGDTVIPGFTPIDRKTGHEAYPLDYPDNSVDEVYASHVLEHFGREDVPKVLAEWVRVLKPGGLLRVAVPSMDWILSAMAQGVSADFEGYMFGGQLDENDYHKSAFTERGLRLDFQRAGLIGVDTFKAEYDDCSKLPVSLNLCGYKPQNTRPWETNRIALVMTMPRLCFSDNMASVIAGVGRARTFLKGGGVFWGQSHERQMTKELDNYDWFLVVDYDTVFDIADLDRLMVLFEAHPDVDALAALQAKRECSDLLFNCGRDVHYSEFDGPLFDVNTAHFGLTLIRTAALKDIPHPWFLATPDEAGEWGDGRTDEDIHFWKNFRKHGKRVCIAPRVTVGHLELVVSYPGEDTKPIYQHISEHQKRGKPPEARR